MFNCLFLTADVCDINDTVQSVDLIAWRRLAVSSRNVAMYISSDYIVRQTIIHFIIASTTMSNNNLFFDIAYFSLSSGGCRGSTVKLARLAFISLVITKQLSQMKIYSMIVYHICYNSSVHDENEQKYQWLQCKACFVKRVETRCIFVIIHC